MQQRAPLPRRYDLASLARLETNWFPPWLIARLAQHGPSHFTDGAPMDDNHIIGGTAGAFWMAAADGVGSQPLSRHGSSAACLALDNYLGTALDHGAIPSRTLLLEAFSAAHQAIQKRAVGNNRPAHEFSTTLAAVLIKDYTIIAAAVGDSSVAIGSSHHDETGTPTFALTPLCSAPQPVRGTFAIADPNWINYVASSQSTSPHVESVIVATDGANNFFLKEDRFRPDWPEALEERVRVLGPLNYVNTYAHFIQNQPPENHDDRTLLVAYRPPADIAPPAQKSR